MTRKKLFLLIMAFTLVASSTMMFTFLILTEQISLPSFFNRDPVIIEDNPNDSEDTDINEPDDDKGQIFDIEVVTDEGIDFEFYNKIFPYDSIDSVLFRNNNTNVFFITKDADDEINRIIINTSMKWMRINGFIDIVTTFEGSTTLIERSVGGPFNNILIFTDKNKLVYSASIDNFDPESFIVLESFFNDVKEYLAP